jgi:hypothetical protein
MQKREKEGGMRVREVHRQQCKYAKCNVQKYVLLQFLFLEFSSSFLLSVTSSPA